jgi:hypothetical protein
MEGICFVIPITSLSKPNSGKKKGEGERVMEGEVKGDEPRKL